MTPSGVVRSGGLRLCVHRQAHVRRIRWGSIDALSRCVEIALHGLVNIWHEGLRVAVDQREPRALDLNHDSVSRFECMIARPQAEIVRCNFARYHCLRLLEALPVAGAEYFLGEHEFETTHI